MRHTHICISEHSATYTNTLCVCSTKCTLAEDNKNDAPGEISREHAHNLYSTLPQEYSQQCAIGMQKFSLITVEAANIVSVLPLLTHSFHFLQGRNVMLEMQTLPSLLPQTRYQFSTDTAFHLHCCNIAQALQQLQAFSHMWVKDKKGQYCHKVQRYLILKYVININLLTMIKKCLNITIKIVTCNSIVWYNSIVK